MSTAVFRSVWLIYQMPQGHRSKYAWTLLSGVGWFVLGFAIWNLDNYFCVYLRDTRQYLTDNGVGFLGHFTEGGGGMVRADRRPWVLAPPDGVRCASHLHGVYRWVARCRF